MVKNCRYCLDFSSVSLTHVLGHEEKCEKNPKNKKTQKQSHDCKCGFTGNSAGDLMDHQRNCLKVPENPNVV